ncbi:MAG TPA: hypothetical protein VG269_24930 [Tepidisphaeraceae bacterium]|jgi:hypothetical protein|nr:hypothetical protein [Tepidisphaeraceae bacterium]
MAADDSGPLDVGALLRELPCDREGRWNALKVFFKGWYGEIGPADGYTEQSICAAEERLKLTLPTALREWYALAGKRTNVWSCQDRFLPPDKLRAEDNRLVIYVENQGVVKWAIQLQDLADDDPPVFVTDPQDSADWIEESPAVSAFALSQMLLGAKFSESTTYSANGQATNASLAAVARSYVRLGFPDLKWPLGPTRIYGGRDLVIETEGENWIWVSGKSSATFRDAVDLIGRTGVLWEQVTEDHRFP